MKKLNEDWLAFIVGVLLIGASILFVGFSLPRFTWSDTGALKHLFDSTNAAAVLWLYLIVVATGFTSVVLGSKKVGKLLIGISFIFVISILAQLLAGFKFLRGFGVENVIVALILGILIRSMIGVPAWL